MEIKTELNNAIQTLKAYCDGQRCRTCVFSDCRDDMGLICKILMLIEDERYLDAVKEVE